MAWYEASADFQRDYYKRRKLAGRSPGNDDEVSTTSVFHIIEYCTGGLVRSDNEATILCFVEKKLYFAVQWCTLFKKVPVRYRPNAASGGWSYGRDLVSLPRRA